MTRCGYTSSKSLKTGLTLVEAVLSVMIVSVLMVSALQVMGSTVRTSLVQKDRSPAMALAQALMSEILQKKFNDPDGSSITGPEDGETRATFDDIDDYNGYSEAPPRDAGDALIMAPVTVDESPWKRSVAVTYINNTDLSDESANTGLLKIAVTVTSPLGQRTILTALRCSESPFERRVGSPTTYIAQTSFTVQVGTTEGAKITTSVNPVNQVP